MDLDGAAVLIQLPEADDAGLQTRDVVDVRQSALVATAHGERDRTAAVDCHAGAVSKPDAAGDALVQLRERRTIARHVVGRAGVQKPPAVARRLLGAQVRLCTLLMEHDVLPRALRRGRGDHRHQERRVVVVPVCGVPAMFDEVCLLADARSALTRCIFCSGGTHQWASRGCWCRAHHHVCGLARVDRHRVLTRSRCPRIHRALGA